MRRGFHHVLVGMFILSACTQTTPPIIQETPTIFAPTSTSIPAPLPTPYTQQFPTPNPELSLFAVHIEVLRVANDDGSNLANVTPDEIIQLVNQTNEIFGPASIRILFDPQTDVDIIQSSAIAEMLGAGDKNWIDPMNQADALAEMYPGKLTVFFRHNPVVEPLPEDHFYWWDYNFAVVSMSDFTACGKPDSTSLAHAIGNYLGLGNTYPQAFPDLASAEKAYQESGYNLNLFDGDGLSDTPADLFINSEQIICGSEAFIPISETSIPITRGNLMSGYYPRTNLTAQQISRIRYMLAFRHRVAMIMPTNRNIENPIEMETASIYQRNWVSTEEIDLTTFSRHNFSDGKGLSVIAGYGSSLAVEFSVEQDGFYDMTLYAYMAPDFGTLEVDVDDELVNDFVDLYGPFTFASGPINIGPYYLTTGSHQILFKVIKKNDLSTGYNFGLDAFTVEYRPQ